MIRVTLRYDRTGSVITEEFETKNQIRQRHNSKFWRSIANLLPEKEGRLKIENDEIGFFVDVEVIL